MLMEQICALVALCDEDERDLVEKLVLSAGDYAAAVIRMKAKSLNYAGRSGEELRTAVEQSDRNRSVAHNALISYADIVNRICAAHNQPLIYTGSPNVRREYGEFAICLVDEIFANR